MTGMTFLPWRTVTLGLHKTPEAYLASIEGRGRKINRWARDIAAETTCSQVVVDLPLVDVSGADLGFTEVYTYREFLERAATFGLYPCPAEAGLALADQYDDQPSINSRRIAMEAIADPDGLLGLLIVTNDEFGLSLGACDGRSSSGWYPVSRCLLATRKP